MTPRFELPPGDWHHAPDRLVALVAALAELPAPAPVMQLAACEQWYGRIRRVVDQIWVEGWLAGATDYAARMPARIEIAAETTLPPAGAAAAASPAPAGPSVPPRARTRS